MLHSSYNKFNTRNFKRKTLSRVFNLCNRNIFCNYFVIFIKYLWKNSQVIFSDLDLSRSQGMQLGTQKTFVSIKFIFFLNYKKWNMLDSDIRSSKTFMFYSFFDLKEILFFKCCNPKGVKLITRLRPVLSHLQDHNFTT